jgi:hypothetical protein
MKWACHQSPDKLILRPEKVENEVIFALVVPVPVSVVPVSPIRDLNPGVDFERTKVDDSNIDNIGISMLYSF